MARDFFKRIIYPEVARMMIAKSINTPILANLSGIQYPTLRRKLVGEVLLDEAILIRNALQPGMHLEELFSRPSFGAGGDAHD